MKRKKSIAAILLIVTLLVTLAGCTTYDNFKDAFFADKKAEEGPTIKIGVYEPMTGQYKGNAKDELVGIELANELFPEILGKKVELLYADNQSSMYDAESVIAELVAKDPIMILGSYGNVLSLVASDTILANSIPTITISATNPLITQNNSYYFRATYSETQQGSALADFAVKDQGKVRFAAVKPYNDDLATETIKKYASRVKKLTGESINNLGTLTVGMGATDFTDTITLLMKSEPEVVFLCVPDTIAKSFLNQCVEAGFTSPLFLGLRSWDNEKMENYIRSTASKLKIAYPVEYPSVETYMRQRFLDAYHEKYGANAEPSGTCALAFDAYCISLKAIEDAYHQIEMTDVEDLVASIENDAETKAIRVAISEALETGIPYGRRIKEVLTTIDDFEGASGIISFGGNNEATKTVTISHFFDGTKMPDFVVD